MNWTDFETIIVQGRDFAVMVEPDDERWVNGDWVVIIIAPFIADDTPDPDNYDVLGGVESFAWEEVARSMAEDMIAAERREATERAAALSMGIPTVGAR